MRATQIETPWQSWKEGADNSLANDDIPLLESIDSARPTPTVQHLNKMNVNTAGPAMSLKEAIAWLKS